MAHPPPELVEVARRIVEQEAGESSDPVNLASAVESACRRLKNQLADLLGSGGVSALLRRALHLAQREHPLLAGVAVSEEPTARFIGLTESFAESTAEESTAAASAILTYILDLLVMLLGSELGMKPVRKLWPRATTAKETDE